MKKLNTKKDLAELGIVNTWTTLNKWIDQRGFPPGRMIGRVRLWTDDELMAWIIAQPTDKKELRGGAKQRRQRAAEPRAA